MSFFRRRLRLLGAGVAVLAVLGVVAYFWGPRPLPEPGSPAYEAYVEDFQVGLAALDTGNSGVAHHALERFTEAIRRVPGEPAAWANRGLYYLRNNQLAEAEADLLKATRLAPDNPDIFKILALVAQQQGRTDRVEDLLRQSLERNPRDVQTLFALAEAIRENRGPVGDSEVDELYVRILDLEPTNLFVLSTRLLLAVHRQDRASFDDTVRRLEPLSADWTRRPNEDVRESFFQLKKIAPDELGEAVSLTHKFTNLLQPQAGFERSALALVRRGAALGQSIPTFLRMTPVRSNLAPPDVALTFATELIPTVPAVAEVSWTRALPVWLTGGENAVVFLANAHEVRRADAAAPVLAFPSGPRKTAPGPNGVLALDWDNDERTDLVLAGAGGVRFFHQLRDGTFQDVSAKTGLLPAVLSGEYQAAFVADVDADGDVDVVLAPTAGEPVLLRNNRDGTFTARPIFPGVKGLRAFVWADFDHDGAPDAALLDHKGILHVFANERMGQFKPWPSPTGINPVSAMTAADVNDDGVLDLVAFQADGALVRYSDRDKRARWESAEIGRLDPIAGSTRLVAADLDNNGGLDLVLLTPSGGTLWLSDEKRAFQRMPAALPPGMQAVVQLGQSGRLDLVGVGPDGKPIVARNAGSKPYHWLTIRPRSTRRRSEKADDRINSYAIGGEIELRTGTLVVKQPITEPEVHFGLGDRKRGDVWRILWPNGAFQAEFAQPIDQAVEAEQKLGGSCPYLFSWDGEKFVFLKDFLWGTPLGMYVNAQDPGAILQTTEWVKVPGDRVVPRNGKYEFRVQANLWEAHYYDYMTLMVVDHPVGTEFQVDERFPIMPPGPELHLTETSCPVARAWDHKGREVTAIVRTLDGVYLDRAGRGRFQGVTNDHWVEIDLGDAAPKTGPTYLVASGFVHPTDSSINFAMEQGNHPRPRGLDLEIPDGKGGWKVAKPALGFPAGKNKTILIRLDGIEGEAVTRRFRLRTNMEIYWDRLASAAGLDAGRCETRTLKPLTADLREHGVVEITQADESSPELPHYDRIQHTPQYWRDQIGFYTRFGDVRELLQTVDDRYAILKAGDEIAMTFDVPPGPREGWTRDFVWISDGWTKDGNLNTRFGKTVLPLPFHGQKDYLTPPGRLEDDPVVRRFPRDWQTYHTRYVTPYLYEQGLRPIRRPRP